MLKKLVVFISSGLLLLNLCGCRSLLFATAGGVVGGVGTAMWLSGKLTQEFNASYDRTVLATESALKSFNFVIARESREAYVTTFRSHYFDGKEIWIDVRRIAETSTKVEVRVGAVNPDKEACSKILERINQYL